VKIYISDSAFSDLEDIGDYYSELEAPQIGQDFLVAIFEHIETLNDHPYIGRTVAEFDDEKIREIIHPPFRVVYLIEEKLIHIIRVWRSERLLKLPENNT
jgi:toxin ParE1/3/4